VLLYICSWTIIHGLVLCCRSSSAARIGPMPRSAYRTQIDNLIAKLKKDIQQLNFHTHVTHLVAVCLGVRLSRANNICSQSPNLKGFLRSRLHGKWIFIVTPISSPHHDVVGGPFPRASLVSAFKHWQRLLHLETTQKGPNFTSKFRHFQCHFLHSFHPFPTRGTHYNFMVCRSFIILQSTWKRVQHGITIAEGRI
jgi:hypothetical protein